MKKKWSKSMEINKIYNGDAYELIKQIPSKSIDLIYTDPPYKFGTYGENNFGDRLLEQGSVQEETKKNIDKISNGFDLAILDEFVRVLKHIYIYMV